MKDSGKMFTLDLDYTPDFLSEKVSCKLQDHTVCFFFGFVFSFFGGLKCYRRFIQNFDGVLICNIVFSQFILQSPQRQCVPLPKNHQINITVGKKE